jgi:bifunctional non-homologous end joining protein LigD
MQPTLAKEPFSNVDWLFEPKWDGFRAICFLKDHKVRFISRNRKFPDLPGITKLMKAESTVIDGEIVALDKEGVPCFDALRSSRTAANCVIVFYGFDLLYLDAKIWHRRN